MDLLVIQLPGHNFSSKDSMVGAAPFVLLIGFYLLDPQYEDVMFKTLYGNAVLGVIVALQIIAFFMIKKIITVKI